MHEIEKRGKLLLTSEYLVLDGADALALPTKAGQKFTIESTGAQTLEWTAKLVDGTAWFTATFNLPLKINEPSKNDLANTLLHILREAQKLNTLFLDNLEGYTITSQLGFDKNWGLGSSSTLIAFIAQWAQVDRYALLATTFGGSGYDLACADAKSSILYTMTKKEPIIRAAHFDPPFKDELFFIYLNKKQNSRDSIAHYRATPKEDIAKAIAEINKLTEAIRTSQTLIHFEQCLIEHEKLISKTIKTSRTQDTLFPDYTGVIKSLGGWGGDFVLATGTSSVVRAYFESKGYTTIISYSDMIL